MKNTIRAAVVAAALRAREVVAWSIAAIALISVAWAAQTNYLGTVFLADSTVPSRQATISASGELSVNCTTGCAGGSASNASDSVATSSDNGKTNAWLYGYDSAGGNWDRLRVDASGNLNVNIAAGAAAGGTSTTDDSAFTAATGAGTPMMGFVTSDSVDSGDVGVVGMLANRQLKVTLYDSAGAELSVGGGTQYTEDAAAAANPVGNALNLVRNDARSGSLTTTDGDNIAARGTNAGELYVKHVDSIPVTDNSGSLTVDNAGTFAVQATGTVTPADNAALGTTSLQTYSLLGVYDGATIDMARGDATNGLLVNLGTNNDVTVTNATAANLLAIVSGPNADDAAASGNPLNVGGIYNATRPTYTDGDRTQVQMDTRGNLRSTLVANDTPTPITSLAPADNLTNGVQPLIVGSYLFGYDGSTWDRIQGTSTDGLLVNLGANNDVVTTNAGTFAVQDSQLLTDDAAFSIATSKVNTLGALLDDVSPDAINEGDVGAVRANTDRILMVQIAPGPSTSPAAPQGISTSSTNAFANSENETQAKGSAGLVYGFTAFNNSATVAYLTFYDNTSAGTTCGTSEISTHLIPASTSGAGVVVMFPVPVAHATGITYCVTTGIAGTGSVAANSGVANVYYR